MNVTLFCPGSIRTHTQQDASAQPLNDMTAERCAVLMATAIANKCDLCFVGSAPVPVLLYFACYYPMLRKMYAFLLFA